MFTLYCLARTPAAQEALRAEVTEVFRDSTDVTPEKIAQLPYVKACLKETFRYLNSSFRTFHINSSLGFVHKNLQYCGELHSVIVICNYIFFQIVSNYICYKPLHKRGSGVGRLPCTRWGEWTHRITILLNQNTLPYNCHYLMVF